MGAFSELVIPVAGRGSFTGTLARDIAYRAAGSWNPVWDEAAGALTVLLSFPGNISALADNLTAAGLRIGRSWRISVPLRSLAAPEEPASPEKFLRLLGKDAALVSGARIEGDRVVAQIAPDTYAAHAIYDAAIASGLMPQDTPTLPSLRGL